MDNQLLHGLIERCLNPIRLGNTAHDTLQEFIDIDVTSDDLVRILSQNPSYRQLLEKYISLKAPSTLVPKSEATEAEKPAEATTAKKDKKEEEKKERPKSIASTYRLISLLGLLGTRNFILALRIFKATEGKFPEEVKGKWNFAPTDYLKKCQETEELCNTFKLPYLETAYAAAYMWDWVSALAKRHPQTRTLSPYVDANWKAAQRAGLVCYAIGDRYPNFAFMKYAMAAGMSHNIGRALMAILFADTTSPYTQFSDKMDKLSPFSRIPHAIYEESNYSVSMPEVSSLALRYFSVFKPIELAIRYQNEPYYLKNFDKNLYLLASTLQVSSYMASAWKLPVDEKDPIYKQWRRPWIKDIRMNEKKLLEIFKWAMTLRS